MSEGKASKKIPQGKLVRVSIEFDGDILKTIQISGDFFMHPEEALVLLEEALKGVNIADAGNVIEEVINKNNVELVGFSPADLVEILKTAMQ